MAFHKSSKRAAMMREGGDQECLKNELPIAAQLGRRDRRRRSNFRW
jgi:hypothetical protein